MPRTTIVDTEYATMWYYPEKKIVRHVYHKFIYGDEWRSVMNKGTEVFKTQGGQSWLSDDRLNAALPTEDLMWGLDVWSPELFDLGWKYWAIVMPDKVSGQMNMNRIMKQYIDRGLIIQVFTDPEEALAWLESV